MEEELFEPVEFDDKWTFKNKSTGKLCEQRFDNVVDVHEGFASVKIDGKWTFFNPSTGELCKERFNYNPSNVHAGFAAVIITKKFGKKDVEKYTFYNPSTGEFCKQEFDDINVHTNGLPVVKIGKKWTFYDPSSGKLFEEKFDEILNIHNYFAAVRIGKKWTFCNPHTGKLHEQKFDKFRNIIGANHNKNYFAAVKIGKKWTFYEASTKKLCEQEFDEVRDIHGRFAAVRIGKKWTYYDPTSNECCKGYFDDALDVDDSWFVPVRIRNKWTYFNLRDNVVLPTSIKATINDDGRFDDLYSCLRKHPEDFEQLPTTLFDEGKKEVEKCLNAIADGIKYDLCSKKGSSKEVEEYTKQVYDMISNKIEKEKQNIAIIEQEIAAERAERRAHDAETDKKAEVAKKAAENIKDLGRNL